MSEQDKPLTSLYEYGDYSIELVEKTEDEKFKFVFTKGIFKGVEYMIDGKTFELVEENEGNDRDKENTVLSMGIQILNVKHLQTQIEQLLFNLAAKDVVARIEDAIKAVEENKEEQKAE